MKSNDEKLAEAIANEVVDKVFAHYERFVDGAAGGPFIRSQSKDCQEMFKCVFAAGYSQGWMDCVERQRSRNG